MFVASRVYNYATGASSIGSTSNTKNEPTPSNTRVKRHPKKVHNRKSHNQHHQQSPPSYASVASEGISPSTTTTTIIEEDVILTESLQRSAAEQAKIKIVDEIIKKEDLYEILGVSKKSKQEEIRRGFLNKSRLCHPDKLPNYPACVLAFQKVSFAYQTLSKPSSRKIYDVSGRKDLAEALNNPSRQSQDGDLFGSTTTGSEETLNGVLYSVFCEFLEGDFEMIRVLVNALNEGNPGLDLGDDAVNNIEGAFKKLRELLLAGKKYLTIVRFELIRLYEIQHSLRQLSYFDVFGRLRLTLQLARVTLSIPMAIDQAMKEPDQQQDGDMDKEGGENNNNNKKDENEIHITSSDEDSQDDDDDDEDEHQSGNRKRQSSVEEDFGMRAEEDDEDEEITYDEQSFHSNASTSTHSNYSGNGGKKSSRSSRRRAHLKARKKAELEAKEAAENSQKRGGGLLGPTAAGLLQGVVKVLETGERWVPGGGGGKGEEEEKQK